MELRRENVDYLSSSESKTLQLPPPPTYEEVADTWNFLLPATCNSVIGDITFRKFDKC